MYKTYTFSADDELSAVEIEADLFGEPRTVHCQFSYKATVKHYPGSHMEQPEDVIESETFDLHRCFYFDLSENQVEVDSMNDREREEIELKCLVYAQENWVEG